jgi:hypothetical protein
MEHNRPRPNFVGPDGHFIMMALARNTDNDQMPFFPPNSMSHIRPVQPNTRIVVIASPGEVASSPKSAATPQAARLSLPRLKHRTDQINYTHKCAPVYINLVCILFIKRRAQACVAASLLWRASSHVVKHDLSLRTTDTFSDGR